MSVFSPSSLDQFLNLDRLVHELVTEGRLSSEWLTVRRSGLAAQQHPLVFIAEQQWADLKHPGKTLDLETLTQWLAQRTKQPYLRIDPLKMDVAAITPLMSHAFAQHHQILAIAVTSSEVMIASAQPLVRSWEANLEHVLKRSIRRVVANPLDIQRFINEFYRMARSVTRANHAEPTTTPRTSFEQLLTLGTTDQEPDANDTHIVNIVDWLLQYAYQQRASDIHLEPRREQSAVRFRIDGTLHRVYQLPLHVSLAVVSRLKILGRMNVAEKRKPQDGRIKTATPEGNEVELRLSTLPTAFGEKMVLRIFDPEVLLKSFEQLGFSTTDLNHWHRMTRHPGGIILVTGPTGSGKTTTLYTTLKQLATPEVNVCTIEDPIEMIEPAFNQMQIQPHIELTFASGIRDLETAEMATQAALTGHLVLSTLHTNDAPSAISRLLELGVPYYLLRATLLGVMAQRLVRTLCPHCKQPIDIDPDSWQSLGPPESLASPQAYQAIGCPECRETGYQGRIGVYEMMRMSETIKSLISADTDLMQLRRQAIKEGMCSLRSSGALKVAAGITTLEEVLRVTPHSEGL